MSTLPAAKRLSARARLLITITVIALALAGTAAWRLFREADHPAPALDLGAAGTAADAEEAGLTTTADTGSGDISWEVSSAWGIYSFTLGTASGPVVMLDDVSGSDPAARHVSISRRGIALVGLNAEDWSVRWYRHIKALPDNRPDPADSAPESQHSKDFVLRFIQTSPDGRYVSLALAPVISSSSPRRYIPQRGHSSSDQEWSQTVAVFSADTGELVRRVDTDQNLLGHALTNSALIVETSPTYYPDGGTVTSYPLNDPESAPSPWPATGWLVGTTEDDVLLSPRKGTWYCRERVCPTVTLNIVDATTGQGLRTVDRVYRVDPGGWVERFADTSSVTVTPNTPDWYQTPRDLENLDSGAHADITERSVTVADCPTPTGRTLILSSLTWEQTEKQLIAHLTPASWLPPPPARATRRSCRAANRSRPSPPTWPTANAAMSSAAPHSPWGIPDPPRTTVLSQTTRSRNALADPPCRRRRRPPRPSPIMSSPADGGLPHRRSHRHILSILSI